ncbi:transcription factor bHLH123-like [Lolium rigidum]|uniref:transcription factor bHLH123-like n=1 Tax=Lolium rigidum TaxID=89674 RepID=UPI001F5D73C8|nr:transcription factor bHLH123-like [Lolium rigidum]
MAEEWWSSASTGGVQASACFMTSPATTESGTTRLPAANTMSSQLQPGLPDSAAAASSFFLDDPHTDWTQSLMGGRIAASEAPTSFNALLHLQGDASRQLLLDQAQAAPPVPPPAVYADSHYFSSLDSSYGDTPAICSQLLLKSSVPSVEQQGQQQFPSFFSSSGLFGDAPAQGQGSPPLLLQTQKPKPLKSNTATEPAVQDAFSSSATRRSSPAAAKKPRIDTPSPMPTFKVRKEKLGDRITALQQLVSPFGKTDTASVLHEAIGYIKFLHDQVASLSSPYFIRSGRAMQGQRQQSSDNDGGEAKEDLRSRGLCLIPVASTYAVANETAPEFWHPTFGGTFR